ncbi:hypothetical protein MBLNU457_g0893t2 [Dothideomycetes sp. NU457]
MSGGDLQRTIMNYSDSLRSIGLTEDELTRFSEHIDTIHKKLDARLEDNDKLREQVTKQRQQRKKKAAAAAAKKVTPKKPTVGEVVLLSVQALLESQESLIEHLERDPKTNRRRDSATGI